MANGGPSFFEALCQYRGWIRIVFGLSTLIFVVHLPYPLVARPGSSLLVIATLNLVGTAAFMLLAGAALWKCRALRREREAEYEGGL